MQKGFLVVNKESTFASYLQHRSIMDIVEEHRSLSELDLNKINIINCDKLLYIYYQTDDGDLAFRSDMNTLRVLASSAFFHVDEAMFILVECQNPLLEDIINSALRDSNLTSNKVTVIHHSGKLMLSDVAKYIAGNTAGTDTSSSYKDVYIQEANKEEKERYENTAGGISDVLPVLTDMEAQYKQRRNVESISAGRVISEIANRPTSVGNFSRIARPDTNIVNLFVVSGDEWTHSELATKYLSEYLSSTGKRCLVVNMDTSLKIEDVLGDCTVIDLMGMMQVFTPEKVVSVVNIRYNQFGFIMQFLSNVRGVDKYIVYVPKEYYNIVCDLTKQFSEEHHSIFITHYNDVSVKKYLGAGFKSDALFLAFDRLQEEFKLSDYKEKLQGTIVAEFPLEDVDVVQFYNFALGGATDE